ncbi:glutamate--cysteine ligase [Nocardioides sp. JQ2195]|nr:glutamate--cysteine ligase [Nocardioides sp. JQ2195]
MRTVGVEEELLLVDATTGAPRSVASQVLRVAKRRGETGEANDDVGGSLGPELQEQQVETDTPPVQDLGLLEIELGRWREKARAAAAEAGALVLASGTTPLPVRPQPVDDERYAEIRERFGLTASEQLSCGCHVHVSVDSDDEAIGALDRIRPWLPVLLAVSANSPFWQGGDSGYESYRSQVMTRWPTNGPTEVFGSGAAYLDHLRLLTETGVPLDEGMAYFDARPSRSYPTLEVRVADVCLDPRDAVLVAALSRALVETGARAWAAGEDADPVSVAVLRLSMWQAGRRGLGGELLDPLSHRPRPAEDVVESLVAHVTPALEATGDAERVHEGLERVFTKGTGSVRQRAILAEEGRLDRAVVRLAELT